MGTALTNVLLFIQITVAVVMIGLILLQQGKGAEAGAAFGSGSSTSLFGATGGANFMSRTTAVLATVFFICTLVLAYVGNLKGNSGKSVLEGAVLAPPSSNPAASATSVPAQGSTSNGVPSVPNSVPSAATPAGPAAPTTPTVPPTPSPVKR